MPRAYGDYEALLADRDIDAIYSSLPNSLHAEWTIRALQAGKAVLSEKPLAANAEQAAQMVQAARAAGRPLVEVFHYRHHPLATEVSPGMDGAMRAQVTFPGGAVGTLEASLTAGELGVWLKVEGEAGRLSVSNPFLPQMGHRLVLDLDDRRIERTFDRTPTYVFQARAFARVVLDQAEIRTTAEDGLANMAAIDAVYHAAGLSPRR